MGWLSNLTTTTSTDHQLDPITRHDRQKCWENRDLYFSCLDKAGIVKPGDEGSEACSREKGQYEMNCAKSWVDYFNQRRVLAEQQRIRLGQSAQTK